MNKYDKRIVKNTATWVANAFSLLLLMFTILLIVFFTLTGKIDVRTVDCEDEECEMYYSNDRRP